MAVTPEDLLAEAQAKAAIASTEVEYRQVAHLAYYAIFHHLLAHPHCAGFDANQDGGDHRQLVAFLKNHPDRTLKTIGNRLPRLRALRNQADYSIASTFHKLLAEEAMDRAYEIVEMLETVTAS